MPAPGHRFISNPRHLMEIMHLAPAKIIVGIADSVIIIAADVCARACRIDTRLQAEYQSVRRHCENHFCIHNCIFAITPSRTHDSREAKASICLSTSGVPRSTN